MKKTNFKKGVLSIFVLVMVINLSGCGSQISDEAKKLYNEKIGYLNRDNRKLKEYLSFDEVTPENVDELRNVPLKVEGFSTKIFYLNKKEQKIWDEADFGSERQKMLDDGDKLGEDLGKLQNELTSACDLNTETMKEECNLDEANKALKALHKKYDGKKLKFEKIK